MTCAPSEARTPTEINSMIQSGSAQGGDGLGQLLSVSQRKSCSRRVHTAASPLSMSLAIRVSHRVAPFCKPTRTSPCRSNPNGRLVLYGPIDGVAFLGAVLVHTVNCRTLCVNESGESYSSGRFFSPGFKLLHPRTCVPSGQVWHCPHVASAPPQSTFWSSTQL